MTTPQVPSSIRATIHQDAINRVAGFFNATPQDILNELLQNARRSGATQIDITTEDDRVTLADDGAGIPDAAVILAFGQTGWEEKTAQNEHPAGMGLYALARSEQVRVRSKPAGGTAWQVDLTPDHFVGNLEAPVERLQQDTGAPGTTVTFQAKDCSERSIQEVAKYYPLPVRLNGTGLDQDDFLREAAYIETWEGIRIGVYPEAHANQMNFHGVIVRHPDLPTVKTIRGKWNVMADVLDCPHLELTLPARKEVIETPFMDDLRRACRRAVYHAMALTTEPVDVPNEVQLDAASLGVKLPDAQPVLEPWEPEDFQGRYLYTGDRKYQSVQDDTVVMEVYLDRPDQQVLARAARLAGIDHRLMKADPDLKGYSWYDRLAKAEDLGITLITGGKETDLWACRQDNTHQPEEENGELKYRPDRIALTILLGGELGMDHTENLGTEPETESRSGDEDEGEGCIILPADLVFKDSEEYDSESYWPFVTKDSALSVSELTQIMQDSYFQYTQDRDSDSYETEWDRHEENCEKTALALLSTREEAVRDAISRAISRHVLHEVPRRTVVTVRMRHYGPMEISLEEEKEEPKKDHS